MSSWLNNSRTYKNKSNLYNIQSKSNIISNTFNSNTFNSNIVKKNTIILNNKKQNYIQPVFGSDILNKDKIVVISQKYHYGDNIFNLQFFNHIKEYLINNNIIIHYYINYNYNKNINELNAYIDDDNKNIILKDIADISGNSIHLWMNEFKKFDYNNMYFDKHMLELYHTFCKLVSFNIILSSYYFEDRTLIERYNKLDNKYKDIDILILNSQPQSNQYSYNKQEWDKMIEYLFNSNKYKIVTSDKVNDNIICTRDDNLLIKDIGAISTHTKYIIGVHSGPMTACYNKLTKDNVIKWIIFRDDLNVRHYYIDNIITNDISIIYNMF